MGHTYIHVCLYKFELTVAHLCPITACGMVSFGDLLSEQLPCFNRICCICLAHHNVNAAHDDDDGDDDYNGDNDDDGDDDDYHDDQGSVAVASPFSGLLPSD